MFPTSCPDCARRVYFFACSCGSKVFFERPGEPWPEHAERCIPYLVRRLRDVEGLSNTMILRMVENHADTHDLEIPPQIRHELKKLEQRDARRRTVLEVFPSGEQVGSEGAVISVDHQVNVLKRLGLPDNAVSRGLFGALLSEPLAELVVQGTRDEQTGFIAQFTFYMSLQQVRKAGLRTGLRVGCILQSLSLPNDKRVWKASDVRVL